MLGRHHPVISHIITFQAPWCRETSYQLLNFQASQPGIQCSVDPKCPVLTLCDHKTTTFLINPLYFTWSLYGASTLYDKYWTLNLRVEQGSVLIGLISQSSGKISISVFPSPYFPSERKEAANQLSMKDLRSASHDEVVIVSASSKLQLACCLANFNL